VSCVGAYRCSRSWLKILRKGWAPTATIAGVLIVGHDRFLMYYGSEFVSRAMEAWAYQYGVQLDFIRPGRPVDNGYIESFNGRLRDECLNVETFFDLSDIREKLERWRLDYNQARPHSALGDRSPEEFVREWKESSAASSRTAGPANQAPAGAVHCSETADPKLSQSFRLALRREGRAGKAVPGAARNASGNEHVARGCQFESVECDKCRKHGYKPTTSTAGRYTFAGRVTAGRH
jgi:putative transposase